MPNYYFTTEHNRRGFYEVTGNKVAIHVALKDPDITTTLNNFLRSKITFLNVDDKQIVAIFDGKIRVVFNADVFNYHNDKYNPLIMELAKKIKNTLEINSIRNFLKKDVLYRVNRLNNRGKLILTASLGTALLLALPLKDGLDYNPKVNAPKSIPTPKNTATMLASTTIPDNTLIVDDVPVEYEIPEKEEEIETLDVTPINEIKEEPIEHVEPIKEEIPIEPVIEDIPVESKQETNAVSLDLAFNLGTKGDYNKYDKTVMYMGDYINYYATRWGLDPTLATAQITGERPYILEDGSCDNPCQLSSFFANFSFKVPVYNESGFTGTYDEFTTTKESINTLEGNIMAGLAYLRYCIDKSDSLATGMFLYNQGDSSLSIACKHYGLNEANYLGDENSISARDLIVKYYKDQNKKHGNPEYLEDVFRYLTFDENGTHKASYYKGTEKIEIAINDTLLYNNTLTR